MRKLDKPGLVGLAAFLVFVLVLMGARTWPYTGPAKVHPPPAVEKVR